MASQSSLLKKLRGWQYILFFILILFLFPLIEKGTPLLVRHALKQRVGTIKEKLEKSASVKEMHATLEVDESAAFFHTLVIDQAGNVVFDNHVHFRPKGFAEMKEVFAEALKKKFAYRILGEKTEPLIYISERFSLKGTPYVLCLALPYDPFAEITQDGQKVVFVLSILVLLIFNIGLANILRKITLPIQELIAHIQKYEERPISQVPPMILQAKDPTGEIKKLIDVFNILAEKVKEQITALAQEKEEKEIILTSLEEGVLLINDALEIEYANLSAQHFLDISSLEEIKTFLRASSLKDSSLSTLFYEKGEALIRLCQKKQKKCKIHVEEKGRHFDLIGILNKKHQGVILVIQEKTDQYHIIEMGTQFIADASHELRTPITIIKGYAETLVDMEEITPSLFQEIGKKIEKSCLRMELLVKNLLVLASAENVVQSMFEPIVLQEVIHYAISVILQAHPQVKIKKELPKEPIEVQGLFELLGIALTNLLENGVKYSTPPIMIEVAVEKKQDSVCIKISDQGKGIPTSDLPHIFKRFYRVDKSHSRKGGGGAGLGLSIVHTIITKHNGKIEAYSEEKRGTSFNITLPLSSI